MTRPAGRMPALGRRRILAGIAALPALALPPRAAWAEAPATSPRPRARPAGGQFGLLPTDAAALIAAARLGGTVGFAVADAETGLGLESLSGEVALPPASVMKVLTSAYVLDRLGADRRFPTSVMAAGPVRGDTLHGDLILRGGGDPVLDTDMLGNLAAALAARGLRRVTGRYLVDPGPVPMLPQIDAQQDVQVGYNPAIAGLNLNFNRVYFEWRRAKGGHEVSLQARGERFSPAVEMVRMQVADRAAPLFTYRDAGNSIESWTVAGAALGGSGSRWLPVRQPARYAAEVFRSLLAVQGIELPAPSLISASPAGAVRLVGRDSARLYDLLGDMLKYSNNLMAEVLGLQASGAPDLVASARAMRDWAGPALGLSQAVLQDHSGLGPGSRISAAEMVTALLRTGARGPIAPLLKAFPLRDADGKERPDHPVKVAAKTGTLNFVSALAGFATLPDGAQVAFAIFCADPGRRARVPAGQREAPEGGAEWARRARQLQQRLLERWAAVYGA